MLSHALIVLTAVSSSFSFRAHFIQLSFDAFSLLLSSLFKIKQSFTNSHWYIFIYTHVCVFKFSPKLPLHGLNHRKSHIKNHSTLFWVELSSESNTTRLHKAQQYTFSKNRLIYFCYLFKRTYIIVDIDKLQSAYKHA